MVQATDVKASVPVVFRRQAAWDGIKLEYLRLTTGTLPKHRHQDHTILISLSDGGLAELTTSSGLGPSGVQKRGGICLLPSGLEHRARLEGTSEYLALYLDPTIVDRAAADARLKGRIELVERYLHRDPVINNVGLALLAELDSDGLSGRLYAESLANVLAVHLLRHYSTEEVTPPLFHGGLSGTKLRQVTAFIADNYAQDIKLAELARVAGMSSFHFAREFKRSTGTSPHQYLIKYRVERAKALMADDDLPLTEVGLRSGFSHQSHFTRLFRKVTGTTPNLYRSRLNG
jgi:AraC family transcriptional regulator